MNKQDKHNEQVKAYKIIKKRIQNMHEIAVKLDAEIKEIELKLEPRYEARRAIVECIYDLESEMQTDE
jgi:hypothetical protein